MFSEAYCWEPSLADVPGRREVGLSALGSSPEWSMTQ